MIRESFELDFQWPTLEPFLFCVHHYDLYPRGTTKLGPTQDQLQGRSIGQDFEPRDGFRMYHGEEVPGFPVHPHRGFETITIVRKGFVDHADSLGAAGRYGNGDVQWMTAGDGVQHSEMFPLLRQNEGNTVELFQIWLNLPRKSKRATPHFTMFWSENIPQIQNPAEGATVTLIAGEFAGKNGLPPPPDSWASDPDHEVSVLLIQLAPHGKIRIPKASKKASRIAYFYEGDQLSLSGTRVGKRSGHLVHADRDLDLVASGTGAEILILQSKPIGEPVVQHGPFVMNSRDEIMQAFADYRRTEFGGWPWKKPDMTHGPEIRRFAKYTDGRIEEPQKT
jgi:redox-sensitive bicupin YhaK (pirin superfamily)